jgi:hypothetical protein
MPYKFHFHGYDENDSSDDEDFECRILSERCIGQTKNRTRCKNRVIIGVPYCWCHLASVKHLKIKESLIPNSGKGLFVQDKSKGNDEVIFKKNVNIIEYTGEIINEEQLIERYGKFTAPYGLQNGQVYIDSACDRGIASLINHKPMTQTNVRFSRYAGRINIKATKNIKNNRELFVCYGNDYHFNEDAEFSTK